MLEPSTQLFGTVLHVSSHPFGLQLSFLTILSIQTPISNSPGKSLTSRSSRVMQVLRLSLFVWHLRKVFLLSQGCCRHSWSDLSLILLCIVTEQVCQGCHNAIDPEVQRVTYNDFSWHASTQCFLCSCCSKCLIGQKFMPVEGMVFCSVECKKMMS